MLGLLLGAPPTRPERGAAHSACEGREFTDRRHGAIIRLFIGTGMHLAEIAGLRVEDVDFDHEVAARQGEASELPRRRRRRRRRRRNSARSASGG